MRELTAPILFHPMNSAPVNNLARWSFWLGALIVVLTHIYMLVAGLPVSMMMGHAILNLIAGALLIFGWMKR